MERGLKWNVDAADKQAVVSLLGEINEDAHLSTLLPKLQPFERVVLTLDQVSRINSIGVREWVNFIRGMPAHQEVLLARCSPAIVAQLNMIRNFAGNCKIESVCAPYICPECSHEQSVVVDVRQGMPPLTAPQCDDCHATMELDDFNSSYFAFMAR